MLMRIYCWVLLALLMGVSVLAGEGRGEKQKNGYTRLICAVLESSNSGDPEIRSNAIVEGLAYLDGEAADVLRVLLLAKEDESTIKEVLVQQLSRSERKNAAADSLRKFAEKSPSPKQKADLREVSEALRKTNPTVRLQKSERVYQQPAKYGGPLSSIKISTLQNRKERARVYGELAAKPSRSSTEILQLFRRVETDADLETKLDRQMEKDEDNRGKQRKDGQNH